MRRRLKVKLQGWAGYGLRCLLLFLLLAGGEGFGQSGRRGGAERAPAAAPAASSATEDGGQDEEVLRVRSQEVLLPISVRDGSGGAVNGLGREAFLVFDNGVRQELTSFNRRRVPAKIVLLLDASGSVFSQMRLIREAAVRFAQGLLKEDELCVMQFADRVELLLDWTPATELGQVEKSLNWRYHAGLRTTFYDGLYLAAEEQLRKVEGRRIIILLTDGLDTAERQKASLADALNAVRRAEASVYVVSLTASLRAEVERKAGSGGKRILLGGYDPREVNAYLKMLDQSEAQLANLAAQTGGRIFLPVTDAGLSPAYQAIAEELRTQYIVTYRPRPQVAAGEYRRIRVLVLPGGYEVGAREGYLGRE